MRLALVGPAGRNLRLLSQALWSAVYRLHADHVVYLGVDEALDWVVEAWTYLLHAETPLRQKVETLIHADAATVRLELERERWRTYLMNLRSLAGRGLRSIEFVGDRLMIMIDDKSLLDEDDILPASIFAYGYGDALIRKVGSRLFVTPGILTHAEQGLALLEDDASQGVAISLHALNGKETVREWLETTRSDRIQFRVH